MPTVATTESEEITSPPAKTLSWQKICASLKRLDLIIGILLKVSPLALLLPAFALWGYLQDIQAPFFFMPSLASSTGLIALFWIGVLIFGSLLYLFLMPSILLMTVAGGAKDGSTLPKKVWQLIFFEAVACFFSIASSFWFPECVSGPELFSASFVACALALWFFWRRLATEWSRKVLTALSAWLASMLTTLPFVATTRFFENGDLGGMDVKVALTCLLLASMFFSLLPGMTYLLSRPGLASAGRAIQLSLIIAIATVLCCLFFTQILRTIGFVALRVAGAYELQEVVLQFSTTDLAANARRATLGAFKLEEGELAKGDPVRLKAYIRYSFGDVMWLCSEPFDPLKSVANSKPEKPSSLPGECMEFERKNMRRISITPPSPSTTKQGADSALGQ